MAKVNSNISLWNISVYGLIVGLIYGLIGGLMITFTTQLIALLTSNPEFAMFDLIVSGILIILIQTIGWYYFYKLLKPNNKVRRKNNE